MSHRMKHSKTRYILLVKSKLDEIIRNTAKEDFYFCELCNISYKSQLELSAHRDVCRFIRCRYCHLIFTKHQMKSHMSLQHQDRKVHPRRVTKNRSQRPNSPLSTSNSDQYTEHRFLNLDEPPEDTTASNSDEDTKQSLSNLDELSEDMHTTHKPSTLQSNEENNPLKLELENDSDQDTKQSLSNFDESSEDMHTTHQPSAVQFNEENNPLKPELISDSEYGHQYVCGSCGKSYKSLAIFNFHVKIHTKMGHFTPKVDVREDGT